MTLEGSDRADLSHLQNKKPTASHIFLSKLFLNRKMIPECNE